MTSAADHLSNPLADPAAATLTAGDLEARFLPGFGMLGASLKHKGAEVLRRIDDLTTLAARGSTAGIPFLYPWANRLSGLSYQKAGPEVTLDPASPLLHFDDNGLPIHGVPWSHLAWDVIEAAPDRITATLDWSGPERLAIFPYPHRLAMTALLEPGALTVATTLLTGERPVPVSFGFHPYFGLPDAPREAWRLTLPAMRRQVLDSRGIPTGAEQDFRGIDAPLAHHAFDDGFALPGDAAALAISGGGRRIVMELLEGFTHTQVFAPARQNFIALEPMTASTNALISGDGLRLVVPDTHFHTIFRIHVGPDA
jgi:aldose 1-epimerase